MDNTIKCSWQAHAVKVLSLMNCQDLCMFGGDVCCPFSVNCHLKLGELFCIVEGIVSRYVVPSDKSSSGS